jgi:hypothetical protein
MRWDDPSSFWDLSTWDSVETAPRGKKRSRLMASNPTPDNPDVVVSLMEDIIDGLEDHETSIGIKQNTAAVMQAVLSTFVSAEDAAAAAKKARGLKASALSAKDGEVTVFLTNAAKILRIALGEKWNINWEPTHFPDNKTQVPGSQTKRFTLVGKLATYFTHHPSHQAPNQGVTAAAAAALDSQVSTCREELNEAASAQDATLAARDTALAACRKRIRGFIVELGTLLGPDDSRWELFGLSKPSDPDTPLPASALTVETKGPGSVLYKWKRARRGTYYRLMIKIIGVDAEFRHHKPNTEGLSYLLEDLTPGQTIEAFIIAANEAGEADPTETVSVVVG